MFFGVRSLNTDDNEWWVAIEHATATSEGSRVIFIFFGSVSVELHQRTRRDVEPGGAKVSHFGDKFV